MLKQLSLPGKESAECKWRWRQKINVSGEGKGDRREEGIPISHSNLPLGNSAVEIAL